MDQDLVHDPEKRKMVLQQPTDLELTYLLLGHKSETELRFIEANKEKPKIISKFVANLDEFKKEVKKVHALGKFNCYVGINERNPKGKSDSDVKCVTLYCFDIDPVRAKNTSSNEEQLKNSEIVADNISDFLFKQGFRKPSKAMSGNGFQLWLKLKPVDVNNPKEGKTIKEKIKAFESGIRAKFESENVRIDSVHNLSRIMKVIGTKSLKGKDHRVSKWIYVDKSPERDEKLTDHILSLSLEEKSPQPREKDEFECSDEEIKNIINSDYKIKKLLEGNIEGYKSRSEAEFSLVYQLISKGIYRFHQIDKILKKTKIGKWAGTSDKYKEITFNKAFALYNRNIRKYRSERDDGVIRLLDKPKIVYKSLGCGIHKGVYYFGTILEQDTDRVNAVVTSDKKIYVCWVDSFETPRGKNIKVKNDEIVKLFNLNYKFDLFDDCIDFSWDNQSIKEWLYGNVERIKIEDLFNTICNINKKYVYHPDDRVHIYVACDIISNYLYHIFNAKGRTYFQAEFQSGKTRQSRIYGLLSFHPLSAGNIRPAMLDRVVESTGGTLIVDNFDNMNDDLKREVLQFIEVYYKRGQKNIKGDLSRNNRPTAFSGYGPLVINNIVGLPEVTESRCNKILMLRSNKKNIIDKKINESEPIWRDLRNKLHICALQNWERVADEYQKLKVEGLIARDLEKAEAVLTIAKCINSQTYKELLGFILENNEQQNIKDLSDNWEFLLFKYLHENVKDELKVKSRDIADSVYNEVFDIEDRRNEKKNMMRLTRYFGKVLSNIPLFKKSIKDGIAHFTIRREKLNKWLEIKNYNKYLNLNTLNTLNTTNTLNTLNTLKDEKRSGVSVSSGSSGLKIHPSNNKFEEEYVEDMDILTQLKETISEVRKSNAFLVEEKFGEKQVQRWLETGVLMENPKGTYQFL